MKRAAAAVLGWLLAPVALAGDAVQGQGLYLANCFICHGVLADGQGPAAASMNPPPTDFTQPGYWERVDVDQVRSAIRSGRPGTPMMAFSHLSARQLEDLVAFLQSRAVGVDPPAKPVPAPPAGSAP